MVYAHFWGDLAGGSLLLIDYRYNTLRCDRPQEEIKGEKTHNLTLEQDSSSM